LHGAAAVCIEMLLLLSVSVTLLPTIAFVQFVEVQTVD
jgi:hypothetical protein